MNARVKFNHACAQLKLAGWTEVNLDAAFSGLLIDEAADRATAEMNALGATPEVRRRVYQYVKAQYVTMPSAAQRMKFLILHEIDLLKAMKNHGGGFASALAVAWIRADNGNRHKLRAEFADLLYSYRQWL